MQQPWVGESLPLPAMPHRPALHHSNEVAYCESPNRAITHHAWPFLNNFINIPWASLNAGVGGDVGWRHTDADSIKPQVPVGTPRDN